MILLTEDMIAFFWIVVGIIALIPFTIFTISYIRIRDEKLLLNSIAFFLFFLKAVLLFIALFEPAGEDTWFLAEEFWWTIASILDIAIIALISISLLKKK